MIHICPRWTRTAARSALDAHLQVRFARRRPHHTLEQSRWVGERFCRHHNGLLKTRIIGNYSIEQLSPTETDTIKFLQELIIMNFSVFINQFKS
jgi:hypothetical protein